ncbi:PGL/p-HBAD biosynthesis glycosyltransferase [compost metagenome]
MNKGVARSTGDWVIFINAGDTFSSKDTLNNVASILDQSDCVYGYCYIKKSNGELVVQKSKAIETIWKGMIFCHQSLLLKRELFVKFPFDLSYRISADFDQFYKVLLSGARVAGISNVISVFDDSGLSSTNYSLKNSENLEISLKNSNGLKRKLFRWSYYKVRSIYYRFLV